MLEIGTKILIQGKHPWAGKTGVVISIDYIASLRKEGMKVKLNQINHECFVFPNHKYKVI